ncbi:unnamed protein product [Acanthoscelides obtectus]|uniref:Uncharacterized protein n=1 Tax=Acanthoscelides obtectus TaxID=200917 RepID=A0A9P0KZQ4_ACAOB|nr:unnamed protein product [Acanthoscelides obtectus]CAK1671012.1 hypothetical protein AOBTE_LOCUS27981 [Acanthoscelides obtectus]
MVIPPWIINPYSDIEETNVIIQEELTELSTNEELKVQFKNGYQQFWLQNNIPVTYPISMKKKRIPRLHRVNRIQITLTFVPFNMLSFIDPNLWITYNQIPPT